MATDPRLVIASAVTTCGHSAGYNIQRVEVPTGGSGTGIGVGVEYLHTCATCGAFAARTYSTPMTPGQLAEMVRTLDGIPDDDGKVR